MSFTYVPRLPSCVLPAVLLAAGEVADDGYQNHCQYYSSCDARHCCSREGIWTGFRKREYFECAALLGVEVFGDLDAVDDGGFVRGVDAPQGVLVLCRLVSIPC